MLCVVSKRFRIALDLTEPACGNRVRHVATPETTETIRGLVGREHDHLRLNVIKEAAGGVVGGRFPVHLAARAFKEVRQGVGERRWPPIQDGHGVLVADHAGLFPRCVGQLNPVRPCYSRT